MGLNQQNTKQSKSINGCFTHTCITTTKKKIDLSLWYKQTKRIEYLHTHTHTKRAREIEIIFKFSSFELLKKKQTEKNDDKIEKKREKSKKKRKEKPPTTTTTTKYTILMAIQGHFIIIHDGSKGIKYECFFFFTFQFWTEKKKKKTLATLSLRPCHSDQFLFSDLCVCKVSSSSSFFMDPK